MTYIGAFYCVDGLNHVVGSGRLSSRKRRVAGCCKLGHTARSTGQTAVCDNGQHVGTIPLLRRGHLPYGTNIYETYMKHIRNIFVNICHTCVIYVDIYMNIYVPQEIYVHLYAHIQVCMYVTYMHHCIYAYIYLLLYVHICGHNISIIYDI